MASLTVVSALVGNGVGFFKAVGAVFGGLLSSVAGSLLSAGLSAAAGARRASGSFDARQALSFPQELATQRFVYGTCVAQGTPIPWPARKGRAYAAWLINSRPSERVFTILLDDRPLVLEGDPYDFAGPGATPVSFEDAAPEIDPSDPVSAIIDAKSLDQPLLTGHVQIWIGLGDQTSPPQVFLEEAGYDAETFPLGWKASQAGRGTTVVFARIKRGSFEKLGERWPIYPGVNCKVAGDFSQVFDPRDPSQVADDPATHRFSGNQALCLLDLFLRNPLRSYGTGDVFLPSFAAAADVADAPVPLLAGGTEPRYRVAGTLAFDGAELAQLAEPLKRAGASELVRIGGLLGMAPGAVQDPIMTITDSLGLPHVATVLPEDQVFYTVRTNYAPLARNGLPAALPDFAVEGVTGQGETKVLSLDLGLVGSDSQAQRVQRIYARRSTMRRTVRVDLGPEALPAVAHSVLDLAWPAPFTPLNGRYEVLRLQPGVDPAGTEGLALRVPATLREYSPEIFAWDAAADEAVISHPAYAGTGSLVEAPGEITITTGNAVNRSVGGRIVPVVGFAFDPVEEEGIAGYQFQVRIAGGDYAETRSIAADARDGNGQVFGSFEGDTGTSYDLRLRTVSPLGASDWTEVTGLSPVVTSTIVPPQVLILSTGSGLLNVRATAPNDAGVRKLTLYTGTSPVYAEATQAWQTVASANQSYSTTLTGLVNGTLTYVFCDVEDEFGNTSAHAVAQGTPAAS